MTNYSLRARMMILILAPTVLIGSRFPRIAVKVEVDPVAPVLVDMGVDVVLHRAGDPSGSVPAITGQGISAGR